MGYTRFPSVLLTSGRYFFAVLLFSGGLACSRSYFDEESASIQDCALDTKRCEGDRVLYCPHEVWQALEDCTVFGMVCSEAAGRVGCVEKTDTDLDDTVEDSSPIEDTAPVLPDAGPETEPPPDAGPDGGESR